MTTFEDGPAKGQCLMLERSPILLRVTEFGGKFDALNNLADRPLPTEKLFLYTLAEHRGNAFVDGRTFRGCYAMSTYRFAALQPSDAEMRDE